MLRALLVVPEFRIRGLEIEDLRLRIYGLRVSTLRVKVFRFQNFKA